VYVDGDKITDLVIVLKAAQRGQPFFYQYPFLCLSLYEIIADHYLLAIRYGVVCSGSSAF
jgi:hypothetical protein